MTYRGVKKLNENFPLLKTKSSICEIVTDKIFDELIATLENLYTHPTNKLQIDTVAIFAKYGRKIFLTSRYR